MRRIFRLRTLFVIILAAAVAAAVSTALGQKRKFQAMSPEDRRAYLGIKIGDKMSEEQIDQLAGAITARLDGTPPPSTDGSGEAAADDTATAAGSGDVGDEADKVEEPANESGDDSGDESKDA